MLVDEVLLVAQGEREVEVMAREAEKKSATKRTPNHAEKKRMANSVLPANCIHTESNR
jgi:hypothetical protein